MREGEAKLVKLLLQILMDNYMTRQSIEDFYLVHVRHLMILPLIYNTLAWIIVLVLAASAGYRMFLDVGLLSEVQVEGMGVLLSKTYFKDFLFTPLWVVAGFLFSLANRKQLENAKEQKSNLLAFLRGKGETVKVVEVLEYLHNTVNPAEDYRKRVADKVRIIADSEAVTDEQLKV